MKRSVTEEEQQLWQQIAVQAVPLTRREIVAGRAPKKIMVQRTHDIAPMPVFCENTFSTGPVGIDGGTMKRLKRGDYPIDGALDLHGMSREKAHYALSEFLHRHYAQSSRCLLVVTGKGREGVGGVLRESVPGWLSAPGLRPMVLALEPARPQHGGTGACYILLRRKR